MRISFITLPLLFAVGGAMADSVEQEGTVDKMESAAAPAKAAAHYRMAKHGPKRLPSGDMHYCLDLKTSAEIIRCSEARRRK